MKLAEQSWRDAMTVIHRTKTELGVKGTAYGSGSTFRATFQCDAPSLGASRLYIDVDQDHEDEVLRLTARYVGAVTLETIELSEDFDPDDLIEGVRSLIHQEYDLEDAQKRLQKVLDDYLAAEGTP